jgi:predicted metalloprotease with PDZ domain
MVHLAFPSVAESHHWIEEGIATYVEPIARARAGNLREEKVWGDLVDGLPQGLPKAGDRGLDFTPTWGRTYWGGALFCLLADVEIRKRTQNARGLEDALRAILDSGGTIASDWQLTKALHIGDDATGVDVLGKLYEKMKAEPVTVDLQRLWQQLGVKQEAGRIYFDDSAPLAKIRRAITQKVES